MVRFVKTIVKAKKVDLDRSLLKLLHGFALHGLALMALMPLGLMH